MRVTRVPSLLASGLLAVVILGSPASVTSAPAAETVCQGKTATIVGTPGELVQGTAGADVVVTNGALDVALDGGDDLVCITPAAEKVFVDAGAGDDVVDATSAGTEGAAADLGAGHDTFTGGDGSDDVLAGRWWKDADGFGPDGDVITTAGGIDRVTTGGRPAHPDHDQIDLGAGPDTLLLFGDTSREGSTVGGDGVDTIYVERVSRAGTWLLDNVAGRASVKGVPVARWDGMESFVVSRLPPGSRVRFVGGSGPERLRVFGPPTTGETGAGDDVVEIEGGRRLLTEGLWVDGGTGRDRLRLVGAESVFWKLQSGFLAFSTDGPTTHNSRARGFEDADVVANFVQLTGTPGDNVLRYAACEGSVAARHGDDTVVFRDGSADWGCLVDGEVSVRGGIGDDTLVGGFLDDNLYGGSGHDSADGRRGIDVCRAESAHRCEG